MDGLARGGSSHLGNNDPAWVQTISHPSLSRRFRTNDRQLHYKHLRHDVFTDTMQSQYKSHRGELYSQVYTTGFHWCRVHPMKLKSDAHDSLSLLFQRDGVPQKMIMDCSKEQSLGRFKKEMPGCGLSHQANRTLVFMAKCCQRCHQRTEKAAGRKMVRAGVPKPF